MAKQANRKLIGGFVVIAVVIMAVSVVIFGSGKFFKEKEEYVLYFDGSVRGLKPGSPVLFRGVQVGAVTNVVIRAQLKPFETHIPVFIEVNPENFQLMTEQVMEEDYRDSLPKLIEAGLRAQLVNLSFITGQLGIEIGVYPDMPVVLKGLDKNYPEIPTIPSTIARLGKALEKLDLEEIQHRLKSILTGADNLVNNPDLIASMTELKGALQNARQVVARLDAKIDPLTENLNGTMTDARKLLNNLDGEVKPLADNANTTMEDFSKLARNSNAHLDSLSASLDKTLAEARVTLKQGTSTLVTVQEDLSEDSPLMYELQNTLREFSATARSLRLLAEYLKRHPDSLLKGKGQSGGK
jgi:paraquat-inducible protein B